MKHWFLIGALACAAALDASAADSGRGQQLYELRCGECHSVSVHGRSQRVAKNHAEVHQWVVKWSNYLGGYWRPEDIADVTKYVNDTYYGFPCTGDAC